jgi:lipoprotein NlpD
LIRVVGVALAALLLVGCGTGGSVSATFDPDVYTVQEGDTLYSIAWRYHVDPDALARWNAIEDPDNLRVGRRIRLRPPQGDTRASAEPGAPSDPPTGSDAASGGVATEASTEGQAGGTRANGAAGEGQPAAQGETGDWGWPASGRIVGTFGDGRVPGRGIDIAGERGDPVKATRAGEVVYSGDGLKAYGRLVIIRHADDYISAYAHNDEVLVGEGERVTGGQQIARMGKTRAETALLHFEIRRSGDPVDPLQHLPPRD